MRKLFLISLIQFLFGSAHAERVGTDLDVSFYELNLKLNHQDSSISGYVNTHFKALLDTQLLTFHLDSKLKLDSVVGVESTISFHREGKLVLLKGVFKKDSTYEVKLFYHGRPQVAKHAPWDGGVVWDQDSLGRPFLGVACEGLGASSWWPNHDVLWDKADSMVFNFEIEKPLTVVSNGRLMKVKDLGDSRIFTWKVVNPMINYNATFYAGNFALIEDTLNGEKGVLDLKYYVLDYNKERAVQHFAQAKPMLHLYESLFGPYPFYEDSYKLVEAPYLGMEHQSAIAYGNIYLMGYRGRQIPQVNFDYIIIHETGHEYWGNNLSMECLGDMWIHESFCTYTEVLYVEAIHGKESLEAYLKFCAANVENQEVIIPNDPHKMGSGDMYHKGAVLLHLMRTELSNDTLWFACLKSLNEHFAHQTVSTNEIIAWMNQFCRYDFIPIFSTYLRQAKLPVLKIQKKGRRRYQLSWVGAAEDFGMHVQIKGLEPVFVGSEGVELQKKRLKKDDFVNPYRWYTVQNE